MSETVCCEAMSRRYPELVLSDLCHLRVLLLLLRRTLLLLLQLQLVRQPLLLPWQWMVKVMMVWMLGPLGAV